MIELPAWIRRLAAWARMWGEGPDRESLLDAHSTGPCPGCGEERVRLRDVRVDDLGYSVRVRDRWSCGCDDSPEEPRRTPYPAGNR